MRTKSQTVMCIALYLSFANGLMAASGGDANQPVITVDGTSPPTGIISAFNPIV